VPEGRRFTKQSFHAQTVQEDTRRYVHWHHPPEIRTPTRLLAALCNIHDTPCHQQKFKPHNLQCNLAPSTHVICIYKTGA
jgi:hypothetical protein